MRKIKNAEKGTGLKSFLFLFLFLTFGRREEKEFSLDEMGFSSIQVQLSRRPLNPQVTLRKEVVVTLAHVYRTPSSVPGSVLSPFPILGKWSCVYICGSRRIKRWNGDIQRVCMRKTTGTESQGTRNVRAQQRKRHLSLRRSHQRGRGGSGRWWRVGIQGRGAGQRAPGLSQRDLKSVHGPQHREVTWGELSEETMGKGKKGSRLRVGETSHALLKRARGLENLPLPLRKGW